MIKVGTKWNKLEVTLVSAKRRSKAKKWIPYGIIAIIVVGVAPSFLMGFPRGRANSDGVSGGKNNGRNP